MKHNQKELILTQPLSRVMWRLSLPAIAAMMLFGLNAFMDTVYIGQLMNETALAGVSLAYPLTSIMMGLGAWAGTGTANLLSIALGDNDLDRQQKLLPNATLFMLLSTLLFTMPAYFFAEELIAMMGGTGAIQAEGSTYLKITLLASPLWVYGLGLNFIIRGEGKMATAAGMMALGLVPNLIFTPVFIYYYEMGVAGAAWATNIGMLLYCVIGYVYFARGKASFPGNVRSLRYDAPTFKAIVKVGFPGFILTIMSLVQAIVVLNAIVLAGTERDLAFFAAANRIMLFIMMPLIGLMRALQPTIGINFGAGAYDRVKSSFLLFTKTGFYVVAPFWLLLTLFPEFSMQLILPDMAFTAADIWYLRVYMLVLPILPLVFMALTFFPAINEEKYGSIIGLARQLVFYVPAMLLLPRYFGLGWVYYASTAIDAVVTIWIVLVVVKLFRQLSVKEQQQEEVPV